MLAVPSSAQVIPEFDNGRTNTGAGTGIILVKSGFGAGYGAYTIVSPSDPRESYGFVFTLLGTFTDACNNKAIVSIAYGAPGSEFVVIKDLLVSSRGSIAFDPMAIYFPLYVPPNTPISVKIAWARAAGASTPNPYADVFRIHGTSRGGSDDFASYQGCDTFGITNNTTMPSGVIVSPGATAGIFGTEISLGTTYRSYKAVILVPGSPATTISALCRYIRLLMGFGGPVVAEYGYIQENADFCSGPHPAMPVRVNIPAGTDLVVTMANTSATTTMDWAAYCFY